MNDYEIGLEDRQTKKRWAGENYGWQSPASFNKLYVEGKLNPVQQQIDRVTSTAKTAIEQTPYISGFLEFAGGVAKTAYQTLPQPVQQGIQFGLEKSQEAAENIAAATGLPVSVTDPTVIAELGMAAPGAIKGATQIAKTVGKDLLTPPPPSAPAMALAGGRGSIKLQQAAPTDLAPTSMPITVSEKWRAGASEGIAKSSEWKGVLDFWSKEREKLSTKAGELTSLDLKKRAKKYVDKLYDYTSTDPRVKSVFGSKAKGLERPKFAEQHHLIPKKFTNDIIEKMMEVGDMDDVTNLWMYAAKMETAIGGAIENFTIKPGQAYMRTVPHSKLHVVTRSADKQALDSIKTATNADDLMEIFYNYITTNLPKNKELAKRFSEESLVVAREMGRESNKPAFFNRLMMPRSGQF